MSLISLATSLISLVLTQFAVMSLKFSGDVTFYCGMTGVMVGSLSIIICAYMIARGGRFKKKGNDAIVGMTKMPDDGI